jgi:flagellar biosynthetic protein FlhB
LSQSDSDESAGDKPHEATPRKLEEARKKGEIARSADLVATAGMAGFLALALWPDGGAMVRLAELGRALLERADALAAWPRGGNAPLTDLVLRAFAPALAPVALVPAAAAVIALIALRGLVFAPARLEPKLQKISPIANARQKFGPHGLFEFAKSVAKLAIFSLVLWLFLAARLPAMMTAMAQDPGQVTLLLVWATVEFLVLVTLVMAAVGAIDFLYQRFDHLRRQRMSHHELREELKTAEGDPHLKQARRARAESLATNRMLAEVPRASVVIVNPTHYAVALRWSPGSRGAPVCVAKGTDEIALRIREAAEAAGVPIRSDPATARALHASVRLGDEISPDHYAPVAAAIRFAEEMRARAARKGRR